ncbi:MAG: single-stranded DNA-binding protein [Anaerolineales bacterium]|nr:single-stranded DNA-binding protein [Anaerolineales bacterium]
MYHKIIIVGNLGNDPEMRYTPGGQAVTNFSVATNRTYTNSNGERVKETTWFRISAWGRQAEICNQYLARGRQVMVEGRLNADRDTGGPRTYMRNDGTPGASYEITADRVVFLGGRDDEQGGFQGGPQGNDAPMEDDIPF